MKDQVVRVYPKCNVCKGQLAILEYDCIYGFEACHDSFCIYEECIECGQTQFTFIYIEDFIDLEAEFLMAYYKPYKQLERHDKDDRQFWFALYRDMIQPQLILEEKQRTQWCKEQRENNEWRVLL